MASSADGLTFNKFNQNFILDEPPPEVIPHDFRDPKVWKQGDSWYMVTGASTRSSNAVITEYGQFRNQGKVCL